MACRSWRAAPPAVQLGVLRLLLLAVVAFSASSSVWAAERPTICHFIKPSVEAVACEHVGFGNLPSSESPFVRAPLYFLASDGCSVLDPLRISGKFVVIRRGKCPFSTKAVHAHDARAAGVIFVNDREDSLIARNVMADASDTTAQRLPLPVVFVSQAVGLEIETIARGAPGADAQADTASSVTFEVITRQGWASFGTSFNAAQKLVRQGNAAAAVNYFVEAVRVNSWDYYSSLTLGQLLYQTGDMSRAKFIFEHTTHIRPQESYSHIVLGSLLSSEGMHQEARQRYRQALAVSDNPAASFNIKLSLATLLPRIMPSAAVVTAELKRVHRDLVRLASEAEPITGLQTPTTIPSYLFAYYASGTEPDGGLALYRELGHLMRRTQPALSFVAPHVTAYPELSALSAANSIGAGGGSGGRIRVGFVSSFFHTHTLMQLFLGVIEGLDPAVFEVVVLDISSRPADAVTERVRRAASKYVKLPQIDAAGLGAVQAAVADQHLDVLVFNDIGLSQHTWFLAFGRFAPVQCLTLSNGMTSGLSTIDYYVSTVASQPGVQAQQKYSESLVLLDSLYFHLADPLIEDDVAQYFSKMQQFEFAQVTKAALRRKWGLPPNANLYFCFQGLFKLHPEFDATLFRILELDANAVVVFMHDPKKESWTTLLQDRFKESATMLASGAAGHGTMQGMSLKEQQQLGAVALTALSNGRVHFADKLPHADYLRVMMAADVHLDPFPFGGGLTTAELIGLHLPVVTLPGSHRSGRLTTAMYSKMGVTDLVAHNRSHFAHLAVRMCNDEPWRKGVLSKIAAARDILFSEASHRETITQWSAFLKRAVNEARRGSGRAAQVILETQACNSESSEEVDKHEVCSGSGSGNDATAAIAEQSISSVTRKAVASIIDFSASTCFCDFIQTMRRKPGAASIRGMRLVPPVSGVESCSADVQDTIYDPVRSPHPVGGSLFDAAVSLDGARLREVYAQDGAAGAILFLTHLFSSSVAYVGLQIPSNMPNVLGAAGVAQDQGASQKNGELANMDSSVFHLLLLIHRSFPRWRLVSATENVQRNGSIGVFCSFHSHRLAAESGVALESYGRESPLRLNLTVTGAALAGAPASGPGFIVERESGEWDFSAALRSCRRGFSPENQSSHHSVPWLPLSPIACATSVQNALKRADVGEFQQISPDASAAEADASGTTSSTFGGGNMLGSVSARSEAKCTLVVPVYKRLATLAQFLKHYQSLPWIQSAVVVWNNPDLEPLTSDTLRDRGVTLPVSVARQSRNSLNNRYTISSDLVHTSCVLAVDDDDLFDLAELSLLKEAWNLVPTRIVGLSTYQRTHLWVPQEGEYAYSLVMGTGMPASMLLNSGTVYSTHFHDLYSSPTVHPARQLVDSMMNGEDVLFNFVVANSTGLPPLIVKSSVAVRSVDKAAAEEAQPALSSRSEHFAGRSSLFNKFAGFFNCQRLNGCEPGLGSLSGATAPPYTTSAMDVAKKSGGKPSHALVLPRYTSVLADSRVREAAQGHLSIPELLADVDDRPAGSVLYQFTAEGSTLRLPNGALYSTVVADHGNLKLNLKSTPQTAPVADSATFAHWVAVDHATHSPHLD